MLHLELVQLLKLDGSKAKVAKGLENDVASKKNHPFSSIDRDRSYNDGAMVTIKVTNHTSPGM